MNRIEFGIWKKNKPFVREEDASLHEHLESANGDNIDRYIDVAEPTLTFFPATGRGLHPAVLVCPGGGYHHLAWGHEGLDIASFLNLQGISAFVLKYRCPDRREAAHADAVRAMRVIRGNAEKFGILPEKTGCIGFSAGAHLCATLAASPETEAYPATDELDQISGKPDFMMLIYPAYLADENLNLAPEFKIDSGVPPCFLLQAEDDFVKPECSLAWFLALKRAGVKAELHIYPEGGHGYSLLRTGNAVSNWGTLAADWLRRQTGTL